MGLTKKKQGREQERCGLANLPSTQRRGHLSPHPSHTDPHRTSPHRETDTKIDPHTDTKIHTNTQSQERI